MVEALFKAAWRHLARGPSSPIRSGGPIPTRWLVLPDGRGGGRGGCGDRGRRRSLAKSATCPSASSRGLGELIVAALREEPPPALLVGLGGSATVDGGSGLREVLSELSAADDGAVRRRHHARRRSAPVRAAEGRHQGDPARARATAWRDGGADALRRLSAGAGAAGGLGAAFAALGADARPGRAGGPRPGSDSTPRLPGCDLVVTGEGQVDRTTAEGKAPGEVARAVRCRRRSLRRVRRARRRARRGHRDGQPVRRSCERGSRPRRAGRTSRPR